MNTFKKYIKNKDGMSYLQTMIIVAVILFIYEILIFYTNLIPNVRRILDDFIKSINFDINDPKIVVLKPLLNNNILLDFLRVKYDRTENSRNKVNNYTIITGVLLITGLLYLLYLLHLMQPINMNTIVTTTIILIFVFIFQYLFYYFGRTYKYIDSISTEELEYFIIKNL